MHNNGLPRLKGNIKDEIIENFSDGLSILDKNWEYLYVNDAAAKIINKTADELIGKALWDIFPEAIDTDWYIALHKVMQSAKFQAFNLPYDTIDVHLKCKAYPLSAGLMLVYSNLTENKNLKEESKTSGLLLGSIIDCATNMIILGLNSNLEYLFFNKAHKVEMENVYGISPKIGFKITDLMSGENDIDQLIQKYKRTLNGEAFIELDKYGSFPDQQIYETRFYPLKIDGKIQALTVFAENVTEREVSKNQLSVANNIINSSSSVAFLWRNEKGWPVEYVSENISKLTGYSAEDFTSGRIHFASIVHPDDFERVAKEVHQFSVVQNEENFEHEPYRLICKDGATIWVSDSTNVRKDANVISYYAGFITDITEKIEVNKRLAKLEQKLEKRTKQLKKSESKLKERELRFQSLYDSSGDGLLVYKLNGHILEANKSICDLLGYTQEQLTKMSVRDSYTEHFKPNDKKNQEELIKNGQVYFETELQCKSGNAIPAEVFSKIIKLPKGKVVQSIIKDISERKNNQNQILSLIAAIDQSTNGIMMTDLYGKITYVNDRQCDNSGFSRNELINNYLWDITEESQLSASVYKEIRERITQDQTWSGDIESKRKDGSTYTESVTIDPVKNKFCKTIGFIFVREDVTEIRKIHKELNYERNRYQFLMDSSPNILWSANREGKMTFVNKTAKEVLASSPDDLLGDGWYGVVHPEDIDEVFKKWKYAVANNIKFDNEQRFELKDGSYRWFKVTANPHFDEKGNVDQWIGLSTDIQAERDYLDELRLNQSKLQRIFDNVSDGYISYDQTGQILAINKSGKELLGIHSEEPDIEKYNIKNFYLNQELFQKESRYFKNNRLNNQKVEIRTADDNNKVFDFNKVRINQKSKKYHVEASFREISHEFYLNKLINASLALHEQSEILNYDQLLQFGLDSCEFLLDSEIAFFHLITDDQKFINLTQWSTNTKKNCKVPDIESHYPLTSAGNWADCVRLKSPSVHNDYNTASNKKGLPDGHIFLKRDLEVPIIQDGKVVAIIGVGNKKTLYTTLDKKQILTFANAFWAVLNRKKAEEELKKNAFFLDKGQEIGRIGAWSVDLNNSKNNWWSDSMKVIHGLKPEDNNPYKNYYDQIDPNDLEQLKKAFEEASKTGSFEFTYRAKRYDNDRVVVLHSISKILKDAKNKPLVHVGITKDITEPYELQLQLKETNKKLSSIIDSIPGVVFNCKWDASNSMNFISPYIKKISGYDSKEFYPEGNIRFPDIIHKNDIENVQKELKKAHLNGQKYIINYRIITKKGKERWVLENGEIIKGEHNDFHIEGVIIDIHEKMKAEDTILQEVYKAEDKTRREISRDIHDGLQQSLITAKLNLDSVNKEAMVLSLKTQKRLDTGMDFLTKSISETRAISRKIMPKSIKDFGLIAAIENLLENQHTEVEFHLTENLKEQRLSKEIELGLFRIIQESLSNITKYSEAHEAFIQINKMKDLVTLTIEDEGKGFDTRAVLEGNKGFGLMSMQSRVSSMNGFIEINSNPGSGTMVLVEIPLNKRNKKRLKNP